MSATNNPTNIASGTGKFVLGRGPSGTFGHVELLLEAIPNTDSVTVEWQVTSASHAIDARERVERFARDWLCAYGLKIAQYGFNVTITEVTSDAERQNEYERAVTIALYDAIPKIGLPVPQIFAGEE